MSTVEELVARRNILGTEFDALIASGAPVEDVLPALDANRAEARHLSRLIADMVEARVSGV